MRYVFDRSQLDADKTKVWCEALRNGIAPFSTECQKAKLHMTDRRVECQADSLNDQYNLTFLQIANLLEHGFVEVSE